MCLSREMGHIAGIWHSRSEKWRDVQVDIPPEDTVYIHVHSSVAQENREVTTARVHRQALD